MSRMSFSVGFMPRLLMAYPSSLLEVLKKNFSKKKSNDSLADGKKPWRTFCLSSTCWCCRPRQCRTCWRPAAAPPPAPAPGVSPSQPRDWTGCSRDVANRVNYWEVPLQEIMKYWPGRAAQWYGHSKIKINRDLILTDGSFYYIM